MVRYEAEREAARSQPHKQPRDSRSEAHKAAPQAWVEADKKGLLHASLLVWVLDQLLREHEHALREAASLRMELQQPFPLLEEGA